MYTTRVPFFYRWMMPEAVFRLPAKGKVVYFTFDDGPQPEVSRAAMDVLEKYDAKATFFCVGANVEKHSDVYAEMLLRGHAVGNHTYHHIDGWKTGTDAYVQEVERCAGVVSSRLFRPPYGRISPWQYRALKGKFRVVLWDVISGDFDAATNADKCLANIMENARPGSIIVMHDSEKAADTMLKVLPLALERLRAEGYSFRALPGDL